jgi:predicted secreted Zn-dependent protease
MIMEWRKSSHSGTNGQCVEIAATPGQVLIRDSKDREGPILTFSADEWRAFAAGVRDGELDPS